MNPNVIEEVKRQASYRWKEIFLALAPQLQPAIEKAGRWNLSVIEYGVRNDRTTDINQCFARIGRNLPIVAALKN